MRTNLTLSEKITKLMSHASGQADMFAVASLWHVRPYACAVVHVHVRIRRPSLRDIQSILLGIIAPAMFVRQQA